ncbi:MAG TPA: hypothetical protein VHA78_02705 [Candidatus Peribacteraceae bacterium]|nr:hypothetical protein [Candidatus Peribacteraceae bacterium]
MQTLSLSDHFASPLMTTSSVIFLAMEGLSLLVFFLVIFQYRRIVLKHQILPRAIQHTLEKEPEKGVTTLLWIYVIMTVFVIVLTTILFWLQPAVF